MRLAIVGAGPAGLAAAHALRNAAGIHTTVFEKSRGVSGRAATRWRDVPGPDGETVRWRFDHGAQYLGPDPDSPIAGVLRDLLGDDLAEIEGAVWPFDDEGVLRPDDAREGGARWTLADGIASLGHLLIDATPDLTRVQKARVVRLDRQAASWSVLTDDGARHDRFDAVLLTPPAPQTAELLRASSLPDALADALGSVSYRSQFTIVWGFDHPIERPANAYAFVNAASENGRGAHDVAWLAVESDKPGRAPEGASILLAQMSDMWTEAHYDDDRASLVAAATEAVETVWGPLPEPIWTDTQRWRYSLPDGAADGDTLAETADLGLYFAGDFTAGKGRVHLAMEEGRAAAERIRERAG